MTAHLSNSSSTEVSKLLALYSASQTLLEQSYTSYEEDEKLVPLREKLVDEQRNLLARLVRAKSANISDIIDKLDLWANADETQDLEDGTYAADLTKLALTALSELKSKLADEKVIDTLAA